MFHLSSTATPPKGMGNWNSFPRENRLAEMWTPAKMISVYLLRTCISVSKFPFTCNFSLLIKFSVSRYFTLPAWISVYLLFSLLMKIPVYLQFQVTLQDFDLPLISVYSKIQFTCNFCLPRNILAQSYFRTCETRTHFRGATDLRKGDLPQIWISVYLLCDMIFCKQISVYPQFQLTLCLPQFREIYLCKFRLTCNFSLLLYHLFAHENFGLPVIPIKLKFAGKPKICRVIGDKFQFSNVKKNRASREAIFLLQGEVNWNFHLAVAEMWTPAKVSFSFPCPKRRW